MERHEARGLGVSDQTTLWTGIDCPGGLRSEAAVRLQEMFGLKIQKSFSTQCIL